jgi:hypothetical protein
LALIDYIGFEIGVDVIVLSGISSTSALVGFMRFDIGIDERHEAFERRHGLKAALIGDIGRKIRFGTGNLGALSFRSAAWAIGCHYEKDVQELVNGSRVRRCGSIGVKTEEGQTPPRVPML